MACCEEIETPSACRHLPGLEWKCFTHDRRNNCVLCQCVWKVRLETLAAGRGRAAGVGGRAEACVTIITRAVDCWLCVCVSDSFCLDSNACWWRGVRRQVMSVRTGRCGPLAACTSALPSRHYTTLF